VGPGGLIFCAHLLIRVCRLPIKFLRRRFPHSFPLSNDGRGFILLMIRFRTSVEVEASRCIVICVTQPINDLAFHGGKGHAMRTVVTSGLIGALMLWNVGTALGAPTQRSCWYGAVQSFLTCSTNKPPAGVYVLREGNNGGGTPAESADPADPSGNTGQNKGGKGGSGTGGTGSGGSGTGGSGTGGSGTDGSGTGGSGTDGSGTGGSGTGGSGSGGSGTGGSGGHGHGEGGASGHSDDNGNGKGNHQHK